MSGQPGNLVAVTCARDEAAHLPALVASMAAQHRPPDRWVVVNDRSTDDTARVLAEACATVPFLQVLTVTEGSDRSFRSKVDAFVAGVEWARDEETAFIACIDADVVLPPEFFARVVEVLGAEPDLGITGARYHELVRGQFRPDLGAPDHIVGAAQIFRVGTYDAIGGYQRLPLGGEDSMANIDARAKGWRTEVVPGLVVEHRRGAEAVGRRAAVRAAVLQGGRDRDVGVLWWFELAKVARRWQERPAPFVASTRLAGYVVASLRREPRATAPATVQAHRAEQRRRFRAARSHGLSGLVSRLNGRRTSAPPASAGRERV